MRFLLLLAASARLAAAWTTGNLLVTQVGNGTDAVALSGAAAQTFVSLSLTELSTSTLALAPTGAPAAATPTSFAALGEGSDIGSAGLLLSPFTPNAPTPFSGRAVLSSDGLFACVSGYQAPAGAFIGATLIPGSATLPLYPNANYSRLVACYNSATGALVNTINLNNQSSFFTVTDIKTAYYYQNPTQGNLSGLILGGGSSAASGTSGTYGGTVWLPMPGGITTQPAANSAVQLLNIGLSTTTVRLSFGGFVYGGQMYTIKNFLPASSSSSGLANLTLNTSPNPNIPTTAGVTSPYVYTSSGAGPSDIRDWLIYPPNGMAPTSFVPDARKGLAVLTCTTTSLVAGLNAISACTYSYTTMIPGRNTTNNYIVGASLAGVAGTIYVVVTRTTDIWLWPVTNTGPYVSSTGTCCASPTVGACCWGNGNAAATLAAPGFNFRSAIALGLPCLPGTAGTPGSCTVCPANTFASLAGQATCTPCPTGAVSSTAVGQSACQCSSPQYYWSASTCVLAQPCVAGSTWSSSGLQPCAACTACSSANRAVTTACTATSDAACAACAPGTSSSSTAGSTCVACAANTYSTATGATSCTTCPTTAAYVQTSATGQTQCTCNSTLAVSMV